MTKPRKNNNQSVLPDNLLLDLPDCADFASYPPQLSYSELMKLCEQQLPYTNKMRLQEPPQYLDFEPFTFKS